MNNFYIFETRLNYRFSNDDLNSIFSNSNLFFLIPDLFPNQINLFSNLFSIIDHIPSYTASLQHCEKHGEMPEEKPSNQFL